MDSLTPSNYARNGKVMLASALLLFLFLFLLFIIFFHTHGYMCFFRRRDSRRRLFRTSSAQGLDPSVLKFLPTFTYSSDTHRPLQDCAVCLSEFEDEDEGRLLPSCNHAFHTHCVDTWFRSHSICPLCRGPVLQPDFLARPCKTWLSSTETSSVSERDDVGMGCSSLPARRKALEERLRGWEGMGSAAPGDRGFQTSDHRILSLRKTLSV